MTTALSQHTGTAPPELPGSTVLRYDAIGSPGVLLHDLGSARDVIHSRFMLNIDQVSAGEIAIAGGIDSGGQCVWQLTLDAGNQALTLSTDAAASTVDLLEPLAWHTVELGLDVLSAQATLRLNGIERASLSTPITPTRYAWLGGAFPGTNLTGEIAMDQWTLSTSSIGVAIAQPTQDHAGDPRRWLVVYNRNNVESAQWAESYRARRGVPYANLCGLDLSANEAISAADYEAMRQAIADYLDENNLRNQIVGVLLGFAVPGYADVANQGTLTPIASYLHSEVVHGDPIVNPLHQDPIAARPQAADFAAIRLTGRIDAPDLARAIALIDRADDVTEETLSHEQSANLFIDVNPDNPNVGPVYTDPVSEWANGMDVAKLRLPTFVYDTTALSIVSDDAVVWGWRDAAPPAGFFGELAGRRALCMQFDPEPEPAITARSITAIDWLSTAIEAGYAAAAVPSRAYSLSSLPLAHLFFEALRQGWTLAEAWLVAQPFARDGLQIVGDPLMTIGFPKAGYDLFGPADRLDQIDTQSPIAILHAGQNELQLQPADVPPEGVPARYLVRRLDDQGRSDLASAAVFAAIEQDYVSRPALPAWPGFDAWRVNERDGRLVLTAIWPASLRLLDIESIELQSQIEDNDPTLYGQQFPATGQRSASFNVERPDVATRYRFRVLQGPASFDTPWSDWVEPAALPAAMLTPLEAQS